MSVIKIEVGRDVTGGLGSKSKNWKLVVGNTDKLDWVEAFLPGGCPACVRAAL